MQAFALITIRKRVFRSARKFTLMPESQARFSKSATVNGYKTKSTWPMTVSGSIAMSQLKRDARENGRNYKSSHDWPVVSGFDPN